MPNNFQDDIQNNTQNGQQLSELLNAYMASKGKDPSGYERNRNSMLAGNVGAGLTGLEYLTGSKSPEVETFYDKHPAQAVGRNAVDSAGGIGAAVAAGGIGHNLYRDMMNSRKVNSIADGFLQGSKDDKGNSSGGSGFPGIDGSPDGKGGGKSAPEDVRNIFGDASSEEREGLLKDFHPRMDEFSKLEDKDRVGRSAKLRGYGNFNSVLRKIAPRGSDDATQRMVETNLPKFLGDDKSKPHANLIHKMLLNHLGGNDERAEKITERIQNRYGANSVKDLAGRAFGDDMPKLNKMTGRAAGMLPKSVQDFRIDPRVLRGISRVKGPLALGGGIALGGAALSPLLHSIHKHTFGDDKIKDWTHNMRQVKGKFDESE